MFLNVLFDAGIWFICKGLIIIIAIPIFDVPLQSFLIALFVGNHDNYNNPRFHTRFPAHA